MASSLKDAKSTEETNDSNVDVNPKAEENGSWNGPNSPTKKGFKESNLLGADVDDGEGEEKMRGGEEAGRRRGIAVGDLHDPLPLQLLFWSSSGRSDLSGRGTAPAPLPARDIPREPQ